MTELVPHCDRCGQQSSAFVLAPGSLDVVCATCRYSDEAEWERVKTAAMRAAIGQFKIEFDRLPESSTELLEWLNGGELPEMGKPVHIGPDQGGALD
jgi:hypothetical protein